MNMAPTGDWLVSILFAATGIYYLVRVVIAISWIDRINNLTHVLMSIVMISMPWGWYSVFPASAQIVVFTLAALWYVFLALFRPGSEAALLAGHHSSSARLLWYHAFMMATMAWMAVAMSPSGPSMNMDTHGTTSMSMGSDGMTMTGSAPWAIVVSIVLGVVFAIAAAWFIVHLVIHAGRRASGPHPVLAILDVAAGAVMPSGMAVAFLWLMT